MILNKQERGVETWNLELTLHTFEAIEVKKMFL